jgi:predicted porin
MKKTAIALALAGMAAAPLAAMADTTVYGSVRLSETWTDIDGGDDFWDVQNESSRLGFRGSEDLGNGLAAIYHYEFGVNASEDAAVGGSDVGGRLAYVGLTGGFGQVSLGRQWNPYYFAVGGEVDVFNGINSSNGYYFMGVIPGSLVPQTRSGNLLVYMTPSFNGLVGAVAVENDGEDGNDGADRVQAAVTYDNGPLFLGAGWRQTDSEVFGPLVDNDLDQYGAQARFNFGPFGLAGSWQRLDDGDDNSDTYDLVGSFGFGNNTLRLGYFDVEEVGDGYLVGLQHNLSKRSRLWIEYSDNDFEDDFTLLTATDDRQNVSIGMRHDF